MKVFPGVLAFLAFALLPPAPGAEPPANGDMELPDRTITGKASKSRFGEMRNRSRPVLQFRPKVKKRDPNVAVTFVGETPVAGAQIWAYPDGSGYPAPTMTDVQAKEGKFALQVVLKADAYAGGAICSPSPLDLRPYLETGVLELWLKGSEGKEVFSIGLLDNGNNSVGRPLQVWVSSRSYARTPKDDWKQIRIPLKSFGGRGSYWSEEVTARVFNVLNWSAISCFSFDIDKERHKNFKIWMDGVVVYKVGPKGGATAGEGYTISNEDFEDFK
jgi:hypothetical protein